MVTKREMVDDGGERGKRCSIIAKGKSEGVEPKSCGGSMELGQQAESYIGKLAQEHTWKS
jgi:hypothetical protein